VVQRQARLGLPRPEADGQAGPAARARERPVDGRRPPARGVRDHRRGTEEFLRLLRESLVTYDQKIDIQSAALGFLVDLPRGEALDLLRERVRRIERWRATVTEHYVPDDGPERLGHIGEIMKLWVHRADTDAAWTQGLVGRLEAGAYTFAGEGEPFVGVLAEGAENPYATGERHPGDDR
jgi:hypothetical protein